MDVATHLLVPYAAALLALGFWKRDLPHDRRRAAIAAVFGIAGAAPDLDGLVDPLSIRWDSLYWLQHRGLSHTLLGAPLFALAALGLLVLLARLWPRRMSLFAWRPALVPAAVLGSFTHLAFDSITYGGVPLWWPFAFGRVMFPLYHWLVFWLLPIGTVALLLHAFGRLSRRGVILGAGVVVLGLVVVGGVRLSTMPEPQEGEIVLSTRHNMEWVVLRPLPNGSWEARHTPGEPHTTLFEPRVPPEAERAVALAQETDAYRGFLMGSFGPRIAQAEPHPDGGWNVTFLDVAQRFEAMHEPRWAPSEPFVEWGYVRFHVHEDGSVQPMHRGW